VVRISVSGLCQANGAALVDGSRTCAYNVIGGLLQQSALKAGPLLTFEE